MNESSQTAANPANAMINDCWNKIGVFGDTSCPELKKHIHCRNCPTYTAAATVLLDRDLPSAYLDEWRNHFSQERRVAELDTEAIIVFRIGDEWLALPTAVISEFVEMRAIHSLPHRRNGVLLGLTNVRGELLVCVALDKVLGLVKESKIPRQRTASKRLIVIHDKNSRFVFPVDEVRGMHRFHPGELTEVPATVAQATTTHTKAILLWQDQAIGCLDDQLLFYTLNRSLA